MVKGFTYMLENAPLSHTALQGMEAVKKEYIIATIATLLTGGYRSSLLTSIACSAPDQAGAPRARQLGARPRRHGGPAPSRQGPARHEVHFGCCYASMEGCASKLFPLPPLALGCRFWDIVDVPLLLARLATDSPKMGKRITALLVNSFFPPSKPVSVLVEWHGEDRQGK